MASPGSSVRTSPRRPAEVAATVIDSWHGPGLARLLDELAARVREECVECVVVLLANHAPILGLPRGIGDAEGVDGAAR